jgi:hypothetical protein
MSQLRSEINTSSKLYGRLKSSNTTQDIINLIQNNVEGGYYHPVHWYINGKGTRKGFGLYGASGETMYGEDRCAGQTETFADGKTFWALMDTVTGLGQYAVQNRTYKTKDYPESLLQQQSRLKYLAWSKDPSDSNVTAKLKLLSAKIAIYRTNQNLDTYFKSSPDLKSKIKSDARFYFAWVRARYNGPGFFNNYSNNLISFYKKNPSATMEQLIDSHLEYRWTYASGLNSSSRKLIKDDTKKIAEIIGWPRSGAPTPQPSSSNQIGQVTPTTTETNTDPIAQDKNSGSTDDATPTQPPGPITQIKRLFKPSMMPIEITLPLENENLENKKIIASTIGYIPLVYYNGAEIKKDDISTFKLFHEGMLPKIDCVITDTYGIFKKTGVPGDDTKISIFINSKSRILASLRMDFKITEFIELSPSKYRVEGVIDIPKLYLRKFLNYSNKTSFESLQDLARELGLGFCTNINNTNDKQTWLNIGKTQREFMKNIVENSYISDTSFQVCYIDYYYNLCFVDVSREFDRDVSEDVGVVSMGFDTMTVGETNLDDKIEPLILTSERNLSSSPGFIDKYKVINNSTATSLKKAYRDDVKYLDTQKKEILYFTVDSQSGDPSKSLVLKASSGDDEFFKENTKSVYGGKLDTNTDDGSGNSHNNLPYTAVNNKRNITDFAKVNASFFLPNCNMNLYPYRKVRVHIINLKQTPDEDLVSARLTGDWLISGIEFNLSQGKFKQVLTVLKREFSLTKEEEDNNPVNRNQDQNNFKTEPNPGPILPNSVYRVGEIYTVKDAKGLEYKMTVEAISTDGKEITTSVDARIQ